MFSKTTKGLALTLMLASSASHAGVWAPTNEDANFFDLDTLVFGNSTNVFGIFEDNANVSTDAPILTFTGGATIAFQQNGVNWSISSGSSTGTLLGSYNFQIGFNRGGTWETEVTSGTNPVLGPSTWELSFGSGQGNLKKLYAIDITASQAAPDTVVPLPPAAWLMGSALVGMFATRRRTSV